MHQSICLATLSKKLLPQIALFIFFFTIYYFNLSCFSPVVFVKNDDIFNADTADAIHSIKTMSFKRGMHRHILFPVTTNLLFHLIKFLIPAGENQIVIIISALIAAINIIIAYSALKAFIKDEKIAVWFTALWGFMFSNLILFSIPETYVLSNLLILLYAYCLININDPVFRPVPAPQAHKVKTPFNASVWGKTEICKNITSKEIWLLSGLTGLATLYNPTLLSLLIPGCYLLYIINKANPKDFISKSIKSILIASLIFGVVYGWHFRYLVKYSRKYTSMANFVDIDKVTNVFMNFFLFSVISPINKLRRLYTQDFLAYFNSEIKTTVLLIYLLYLCLAIVYLVRNRKPIIDSFLCWMLSIVIFHIYFNPMGSILYSAHLLFPMTLIFADIFKEINFKYKYLFLNIFLFMMALNNYLSIIESGHFHNFIEGLIFLNG